MKKRYRYLLLFSLPALLEQAGFHAQTQSRYIPGPKIFSFHYWGEATAQ